MTYLLCRSLPFNLRRVRLHCILNDAQFYSPSFILTSRSASRFRGHGHGGQGGDNPADRRRGNEHSKAKQLRFSGINLSHLSLQIIKSDISGESSMWVVKSPFIPSESWGLEQKIEY